MTSFTITQHWTRGHFYDERTALREPVYRDFIKKHGGPISSLSAELQSEYHRLVEGAYGREFAEMAEHHPAVVWLREQSFPYELSCENGWKTPALVTLRIPDRNHAMLWRLAHG